MERLIHFQMLLCTKNRQRNEGPRNQIFLIQLQVPLHKAFNSFNNFLTELHSKVMVLLLQGINPVKKILFTLLLCLQSALASFSFSNSIILDSVAAKIPLHRRSSSRPIMTDLIHFKH